MENEAVGRREALAKDILILSRNTHIDGQAHFHEEGAAFFVRHAVQCKGIHPVRRQTRKAQVHLLFKEPVDA